MQHRLTSRSDLGDFLPAADEEHRTSFAAYAGRFNIAITPYTLSLIEKDAQGLPLKTDPIWAQFRFYGKSELQGAMDYDGRRENWENPTEMPTPILQHKYPDRAILRLLNTCFGHCNYCYLTARVLDREASSGRKGGAKAWSDSLAYLRSHAEIEDVLLSGGDPLVFNNDHLASILHDLREIPSIRSLRVNTRASTFNPFRFDLGLAELFKRYQVTAMEIHLAHPRELTSDLDERLAVFDEVGYRPLILWRSPLLKGINDSEEVLTELFRKLYVRRITPYYLFHSAPFTLGRSTYGVSIRRGVELMRAIRRHVPGPAFPRYTLFHIQGKHDIPLEPEGSPTFVYGHDAEGHPEVRFMNWRGNWVSYPDVQDDDD